MCSVKSCYGITLMQLLTIIIFSHFVKIQLNFFIAIANDREITQKKQRPDPNPNDIKTAVFCETKKYNSSKVYLVLQC